MNEGLKKDYEWRIKEGVWMEDKREGKIDKKNYRFKKVNI